MRALIFAVAILSACAAFAADPNCSEFTYKPNGTLRETRCTYDDPVFRRIQFTVNLSTPAVTLNGPGEISNPTTFRTSARTAYQAEIARLQAEKAVADALTVERAKIATRVRESDLQ